MVVWCPDATGDLALQVDLRRPVSLSAHGTHQDKTIPVGNQGLSAVMRPGEVTHLVEVEHMCLCDIQQIIKQQKCIVLVLRTKEGLYLNQAHTYSDGIIQSNIILMIGH